VWNAFRLIQSWKETEGKTGSDERDYSKALDWFEQKLLSETAIINDLYSKYRISDVLMSVYKLIWDDFCSWYLEIIKPGMGQTMQPKVFEATIGYFESLMKLLHPFMPFITEELWQNLPHEGESIVIASYPQFGPDLLNESAESQTELVQEIIIKVRNIRAEMKVDARQVVSLRVATSDKQLGSVLSETRDYIFKLAQVGQMDIVPQLSGNKLAAQAVARGLAIEVPLEGLIDVDAEKSRLSKEMEKVRREIESLERKLSNASFVDRAPKEVVDENRRRLADYQDQAAKLSEGLRRLE
jgi:valyl-tRNA synthetase